MDYRDGTPNEPVYIGRTGLLTTTELCFVVGDLQLLNRSSPQPGDSMGLASRCRHRWNRTITDYWDEYYRQPGRLKHSMTSRRLSPAWPPPIVRIQDARHHPNRSTRHHQGDCGTLVVDSGVTGKTVVALPLPSCTPIHDYKIVAADRPSDRTFSTCFGCAAKFRRERRPDHNGERTPAGRQQPLRTREIVKSSPDLTSSVSWKQWDYMNNHPWPII